MSVETFGYRYADSESAGYAPAYLQREEGYTVSVSQENAVTIRVRSAAEGVLSSAEFEAALPKNIDAVKTWLRSTMQSPKMSASPSASLAAGVFHLAINGSSPKRGSHSTSSPLKQASPQSPPALLEWLKRHSLTHGISTASEYIERFLRGQGPSFNKEKALEIIHLISEQMTTAPFFNRILLDIGLQILRYYEKHGISIRDCNETLSLEIIRNYGLALAQGENSADNYLRFCQTAYQNIIHLGKDRENALACAFGVGRLFVDTPEARRSFIFKIGFEEIFYQFYMKGKVESSPNPLQFALEQTRHILDLNRIAYANVRQDTLFFMRHTYVTIRKDTSLRFWPYDQKTTNLRPAFTVTLNLLARLDPTLPQEELATACTSGIDQREFFHGQAPYVDIEDERPEVIRLHIPKKYVHRYNTLFEEKLPEGDQETILEFPTCRFEFMLRKWGIIENSSDTQLLQSAFTETAAEEHTADMFPKRQDLAPPELLPITQFAREQGGEFFLPAFNGTHYRTVVEEVSGKAVITMSPALDSESLPLFSPEEQGDLEEAVRARTVRLTIGPNSTVVLQIGSGLDTAAAEKIIAEAASIGATTIGRRFPEIEDAGFSLPDMITLKAALKDGRFPLLEGEANVPRTMIFGENDEYGTWCHTSERGYTVVNIQRLSSIIEGRFDQHLSLEIDDEGHVLSIHIDHQKSSGITQQQKELILLCSRIALESCANYAIEPPEVMLRAVMRGPQQAPWHHLLLLSEAIDTCRRQSFDEPPTLRVTFVDNGLEPMPASDEGGVSRAFLDNLFSGIAREAKLQFFRPPNSETTTPFPVEGNEGLYRAIGNIFMACYTSERRGLYWNKTLTTGDHFSPELFQAIFSFSRDDAHALGLSPETKSRLEQLILDMAAKSGRNRFLSVIPTMRRKKSMETLLDSFINCEEHNLNDVSRILREISTLESSIQQLEEGSARTEARQALIELRRKNDSLNTLYTILLLATEGGTLKNQDGEESDPADIFQSVLDATRKPYAERTRADRHLLTRLAKQCHQCATDPTFVSTKIEEAGVDLSALQQIAIGMQNAVDSRPFGAPGSLFHMGWEALRSIPHESISLKIQGETNREKVVESFHYERPSAPEHVAKRLQWIREWILDEITTHAEVKQFLKWVTGSAGTPPQGIFFVDSHRARSYPVVHTCANTIEISPLPYNDEEIPAYDSKEGWIALIKQLMEETAFTTL